MFQRIKPRKGSMPMYLLLLMATVFMFVALKQCSTRTLAPRSEQIAGGDTLNIAIEISPMGLATTGDTLGGYYYNLLRRIEQSTGRPMKFHPFTLLETALQGLDEGRYQLVVSDIPATSEMKAKYIFIEPGEIDRQMLVQLRPDSAGAPLQVPSQFQLGGKRVTLPKGSPFAARLRNLSHEIGDTIMVDEDDEYSSEQLVIMTALGEIPLTVASERLAAPLLKRYPRLDASIAVSFNQFQGWAMAPRDSLLRDTIATWIKADATGVK